MPVRYGQTCVRPLALALAALLVQIGCDGGSVGSPSPESPSLDDDDGSDTSPPLPGSGGVQLTCAVEISPWVPTSASARWSVTGDAVVDTWVEVACEGQDSYRVSAEVDAGSSFHASLVWLPPASPCGWRIVVVTERGAVVSEQGEVVTGAPPVELPTLGAVMHEWDADPGFLVTTLIGDPFATVVIDADGAYRWWYVHDPDAAKVTRSRLSSDGEWMLMLVEHTELSEEGPDLESDLVRLRLDGTAVESWPLVGVHQDFVELPDGTLTLLGFDARELDGEEVVGDALVELEPDGGFSQVWSIWEHAAYDPDVEQPWEATWSHASALDHDEASDTYQLSLRNLDTILSVYRPTGEVTWRLGGAESDVALASGDTELFTEQHQFVLGDDRLLVFDNGAVERGASRAVEYALDAHQGTATELWSHAADPALYCFALGDVARLPGGHTLITWSTSGRVDVVTPEGGVVWTLQAPLGWGIGYVDPVDPPPGI